MGEWEYWIWNELRWRLEARAELRVLYLLGLLGVFLSLWNLFSSDFFWFLSIGLLFGAIVAEMLFSILKVEAGDLLLIKSGSKRMQSMVSYCSCFRMEKHSDFLISWVLLRLQGEFVSWFQRETKPVPFLTL